MIKLKKIKYSDFQFELGYGTSFFFMLCAFLLTFYAISQLYDHFRMVDRTYKVLLMQEALLGELNEGETVYRWYLLTADKNAVLHYNGSKLRVDSVFEELRRHTIDNSSHQQSLIFIQSIIKRKRSNYDRGIKLYRKNNYKLNDSLHGIMDDGKKIMVDLKREVYKMQHREDILHSNRSRNLETYFRAINPIIIITLGTTIILALFSLAIYAKEHTYRKNADKQVKEYAFKLEERVNELEEINTELTRLRQFEKYAATGNVARTIAHEVRNPIFNINIAYERIMADKTLSDENKMLLDLIYRNSARINHLITELLHSTKFPDLVREVMPIRRLLDETLEMAKDRIQLMNLKMISQYGHIDSNVSVDPDKIKIAFLNIIINALEAMEPGRGVLTVKAEKNNDKCIITIADNGIGIDSDSLSKLFVPYFTRKSNGTGLGLANTQNIILSHDGSIQVKSKVGQGTIFTITLKKVF